jgi:hypothetical protein
MISFNDLLKKAKFATLEDTEKQIVLNELSKSNTYVDRYTLIHIIGQTRDRSLARFVEPFLDCQSDPMVARIALHTLCSFFDLTQHYLSYVHKFLDGADWDEGDQVKQIAIAITGRYLKVNHDENLARKLLKIAGNDNERDVIKEGAIRAMADSLNSKLPVASKRIDLDSDFSKDTLYRFRQVYKV